MKFNHSVSFEQKPTFRTQSVAGMFDAPVGEAISHSWDVDIPFEDEPWDIGLIVGASGSGKTTIGRRIVEEMGTDAVFHEGFDWSHDSAFINDFPEELSVQEIVAALSHCGFNSPKSWMIPFSKLSNGQQFRADMARIMTSDNGTTVIDEFTSVVDRTVAKAASESVQKYVRKRSIKQAAEGKTPSRLVCLSCHFDIAEWLQPDWIYNVDTGEFTRGSLRRPPIKLTIRQVHYSAWQLFKQHHYLDAGIEKAAQCFLAEWEGTPVGFIAVLHQPHAKAKNIKRGHRVVVLPDFQGIGVGRALIETIAEHYVSQGFRFRYNSSHPAIIRARANDPRWIVTRKPGNSPKPAKSSTVTGQALDRITASIEYIGDNKDGRYVVK